MLGLFMVDTGNRPRLNEYRAIRVKAGRYSGLLASPVSREGTGLITGRLSRLIQLVTHQRVCFPRRFTLAFAYQSSSHA